MAKFSGIKGSVALSGTSGNWGAGVVTGNLKSWSGDLNTEPQDTTSKSDAGYRSFVNGNKVMRGTIVMFADDTTVLSLVTTSNPTVTLNLFDDTSDRSFSFAAVLDTISTGADINTGAAPEVTFTFMSNGAITIA